MACQTLNQFDAAFDESAISEKDKEYALSQFEILITNIAKKIKPKNRYLLAESVVSEMVRKMNDKPRA